MYFENLTGWKEVGSHCFSVEMGGTHIVLDAGVHPKKEGLASLPNFNLLEKGSVEAVLVTHAHLDHLGAVPVLLDKQPGARAYMTLATMTIGEAMLHNSINVMSSKRVEEGIVEYPLFGHKELELMMEDWQPRELNQPFKIGRKKNVTATFYDAGHILGSAGVLLEGEGHRVFYTGDVNFENQTTIPGASFPTENIDTLIMECTRGAVGRDESYTRANEEYRFAQNIQNTLDRGGIVLIPVFALGKTQEVLTMIHNFKLKDWVTANTPVYIGGLSTKVTRIFDEFADTTPRNDPGFLITEEVDYTVAGKKRKTPFRCQPGCIYVLSSGMMTEKTLSNSVASQILPHPSNALLFVGYADPDSPAGLIRQTPHGEKVKLDPKGPELQLNCQMEVFDFSGHASRDQLVKYAQKVSPQRLFLVHGDEPALNWMKEACEKALPHTEVIVAEPDVKYQID